MDTNNLFSSFWMAGFECSDKLNCFGERVDLLKSSGHLQKVEEDYENLLKFNLHTVREGVGWARCETSPFHYDFSPVKLRLNVAADTNIQIIWDLCHFGFPDDLTPLHPKFEKRFIAFCKAFAHTFKDAANGRKLLVTPINEINFLSWLGGDVAGTSPYCKGMGWDIKYKLTKAFIAGIECIKNIIPDAIVLTSEPLIFTVPQDEYNQEHEKSSRDQNEFQFQVTDILTGKICPELNGNKNLIDIIGVNFYHNNQFENGTSTLLNWQLHERDSRWKPLHILLQELHEKYLLPIYISETSHSKELRSSWLEYITQECIETIKKKIPLKGVCIYPIVDRKDWDFTNEWHQSGLWDNLSFMNGKDRSLNKEYAMTLLRMQKKIGMNGELNKITASMA